MRCHAVERFSVPGAGLALALSYAGGLLGCSAPRPDASGPEQAPHNGALTLTIENDVLTGTDNNYTNAIGIGWSTDEVGTYGEGSFVRLLTVGGGQGANALERDEGVFLRPRRRGHHLRDLGMKPLHAGVRMDPAVVECIGHELLQVRA